MFTKAMSFITIEHEPLGRKSKTSCTIEIRDGMIKFESARWERIRMRPEKDAINRKTNKSSSGMNGALRLVTLTEGSSTHKSI